jgi:hypothetical protein
VLTRADLKVGFLFPLRKVGGGVGFFFLREIDSHPTISTIIGTNASDASTLRRTVLVMLATYLGLVGIGENYGVGY